RAEKAPELSLVDERPENRRGDCPHHDNHQVVSGIDCLRDGEAPEGLEKAASRERIRSPDEAQQVLKDQQQPESDQELVFLRALVERPQQYRLDNSAECSSSHSADWEKE